MRGLLCKRHQSQSLFPALSPLVEAFFLSSAKAGVSGFCAYVKVLGCLLVHVKRVPPIRPSNAANQGNLVRLVSLTIDRFWSNHGGVETFSCVFMITAPRTTRRRFDAEACVRDVCVRGNFPGSSSRFVNLGMSLLFSPQA